MRMVGTCAMGVRAPIIRPGDDLVTIVADSVMAAVKEKDIKLKEKDIIAVTEAVVAKSERNFATTGDIANEIREKLGSGTIGLIFPILSRNRFQAILEGISEGCDDLVIMLSYPFDEVGNPLVSIEKLYDLGVSKFDKTYTSDEFYDLVGEVDHPFTGVDYIKTYLKICKGKAKIILSNDPLEILKYTKKVISADIHTRFRTKRLLLANGAEKVLTLSDILCDPSDEHGYNELTGVLGSNRSKEGQLKLFPRTGGVFVKKLQEEMKKRTGITLECMVYGDGAFKDPVGGIWELADPVVSPAHTEGLLGTPNEIKFKYVADNNLEGKIGEDAINSIKDIIKNKEKDLKNQNISLGTTPRRITDLVGSLCDLVSGSGDKGTPIVLITGYFDNYASE